MTNIRKSLQGIVFLGLVLASQVHADGDIDAGRKVWESRCSGCHALDEDIVGPRHRGVWGRRAGTVPGFRYSSAVRGLDVVWNDDTLSRWLTDPEAMAPGQRMGYQVDDAAQRSNVIAYLKSVRLP